jgi:cytochrome c-type biogenesis protein CcmH/NrfF
VLKDGESLARISPAKFIYEKPEGTTTTEVAIRSTLGADVYAIMNSVNPTTKIGTFRVIVRPFVAWIWLGGLLMIFGTAVSMAPSVSEVLGEARERARFPRLAGATSVATIVGILALALLFTVLLPVLAHAQSDSSSSLHAGTVTMHSPEEKQLFERLLCECGGCQRLPLSGCVCEWAEKARARIREDMAGGKTPAQVQQEYREEHGAQAIAIPSDKGFDRALWAVPIAVIAGAALMLVRWGRRWTRGADAPTALAGATAGTTGDASGSDARYDAALERELERLDDKG